VPFAAGLLRATTEKSVEILGIVRKSDADVWLAQAGRAETEEE
jgi:hypothetical protein